MPLKQITQEDLQYANIKPGPWFVATGCSWRRILSGSADEPIIVPTNHPTDHHPDLSARNEELKLAAASPELLVSLINMVSCLAPAATDFNEVEQKAFDEAVAAIKKAGAMRLLDAVLAEE